MPNALLEYQLIIRDASTVANPNGTTNAIVVTSVRGGSNPYLVDFPQGDGYEVDPTTGSVRTSSYNVLVADPAVGSNAGGTLRFLTQSLVDSGGLQQLLSRRAYIQTRTDGGAWTTLIAGYVLAVRLVDAVTYEINIGDTRRIEQNTDLSSTGQLLTLGGRGCLTGGPITRDWGRVISRGGYKYRVVSSPGNTLFSLIFDSGYKSYHNAPIVRDWRQLVRDDVVNEVKSSYAIVTPNGDWGYPHIVIQSGTTTTNGAPTAWKLLDNPYGPAYGQPGYGGLLVDAGTLAAVPANGSTVYISLFTTYLSDRCPLYVDAHPVDIVTAIWDDARIYWKNPGDPNPAWVATIRDLLGVNTRIAVRLTETQKIGEFLDQTIFGPFGISVRVNSTTGAQELFDCRGRGTATPSITINTADLTSADTIVFDVDESTVIGRVLVEQDTYTTVFVQGTNTVPSNIPTDGVIVSTEKVTARNADATVFSGRELSYKLPAMFHTADDFFPSTGTLTQSIATPIFRRFGRGVQMAEVEVLAGTSAATAQVGDEVFLSAAHTPNGNYRIGEMTAPVGRIMQVVRRTERPTGPAYKLLDVGVQNVTSPAPVVSTQAAPSSGTFIGQFKIDNAAALNSAFLWCEVQWIVSATTPLSTVNGNSFATYTPGSVPTGWVSLPPVPPGSVVWVRARSQGYALRWSAWTAWDDISLVALPQPGAVTISGLTATSATLTWTNTNTEWPVAILLYQGSVAPVDFSPYRLTQVIPGTTTTTIRDVLGAGLPYIVAIAYDTPQGYGPIRTASFTAAGSGSALLRPAGFQIVPSDTDANLAQGIVLALYANNQGYDFLIERSDNGGTTWAEIATLPGSSTLYVDTPEDPAITYQYRVAHKLGGFSVSAYTPVLSATIGGIPSTVTRPPASAPVITPLTTGTGTQVTVAITITDPQNRVVSVEFNKNYAGWVADTAPYSATQTFTVGGSANIAWRVYGYDVNGSYGIIRQGSSDWPLMLGTNPTINNLTRARYNAGTGRYEVWYRYYLERGDGTREEDPLLGLVTVHGPENVKNQNGTVATVTKHTPKEADGWRASWPSTASDTWTFDLTSYGLFEELIYPFPYQDTDNQVDPFPTTKGISSHFVAGPGGGGSSEPWVDELIEVVWDAPSAESGNAIEMTGRCYNLYNTAFASNTAYVTVIVTDGAADSEPSATATITAATGPVGDVVGGGGTATAVFKTDASGVFRIRVSETLPAFRYIWVRSGGHMQVYVKARDGIVELPFA